MHPILLLILVIAVLFTVSWLKRQPPARRQASGFKVALIAAGVLLVLALVTGRLNPLIAMVAAAIPVMQRLMAAKSIFDRIRSMAGPSSGQSSSLSTRFLEVTLDHDSGEMEGEVREGAFQGRRLTDLERGELLALLRECQSQDAQSAAVLEAYLDRRFGPQWRDEAGAAAGSAGDTMTQREACQILGVDEGADAQTVVSAHRRLMQKMHPDRGGSSYLAAKINQAKDLLLGDS